MTKTIKGNNVSNIEEPTGLVLLSSEPKENGFYDAKINGQEIELLIGGSPCQASL